VAPAPYAKMTPENVIVAIKRNQMIFVSLCLTFNNNLYSFFSENGSLGWDVPTMKQLCTTCVTYKKKIGQWNHFIVGGIQYKQGLLVDSSLVTPSICSP
jgi:hypothetical protein